MKKLLLVCSLFALLSSCGSHEKKGFNVNSNSPEENGKKDLSAAANDSTVFFSRPNGILITGYSNHRLVPIYKLNTKESRGKIRYYTGSNSFHRSYSGAGRNDSNNWHNNYMPGFEAMYGFNLVNVEHHHSQSKESTALFEEPVLIKTVYYPSYSNDTLNGMPVRRDYYMISVYDENTNKDQFLNTDDLRRFYLFDLNGQNRTALVPKNYSVKSSQYDAANDYMYVYAVLDENNNGLAEDTEAVHVFWIDLANPEKRGRLY